jgi:hypothetical protein
LCKVVIDPGICGFVAEVKAKMEGDLCALDIACECEPVQEMAKELTQVDPMTEIGFHGDGPQVLKMFAKHCPHPACPVPSGILKAVEVAAGLALPKDATITVMKGA